MLSPGCGTRLVQVEHDIQLAHRAEVAVQRLHEGVHHLQHGERVLVAIHARKHKQRGVAAVDHLRSAPRAVSQTSARVCARPPRHPRPARGGTTALLTLWFRCSTKEHCLSLRARHLRTISPSSTRRSSTGMCCRRAAGRAHGRVSAGRSGAHPSPRGAAVQAHLVVLRHPRLALLVDHQQEAVTCTRRKRQALPADTATAYRMVIVACAFSSADGRARRKLAQHAARGKHAALRCRRALTARRCVAFEVTRSSGAALLVSFTLFGLHAAACCGSARAHCSGEVAAMHTSSRCVCSARHDKRCPTAFLARSQSHASGMAASASSSSSCGAARRYRTLLHLGSAAAMSSALTPGKPHAVAAATSTRLISTSPRLPVNWPSMYSSVDASCERPQAKPLGLRQTPPRRAQHAHASVLRRSAVPMCACSYVHALHAAIGLRSPHWSCRPHLRFAPVPASSCRRPWTPGSPCTPCPTSAWQSLACPSARTETAWGSRARTLRRGGPCNAAAARRRRQGAQPVGCGCARAGVGRVRREWLTSEVRLFVLPAVLPVACRQARTTNSTQAMTVVALCHVWRGRSTRTRRGAHASSC
jgi:hypothetical protein